VQSNVTEYYTLGSTISGSFVLEDYITQSPACAAPVNLQIKDAKGYETGLPSFMTVDSTQNWFLTVYITAEDYSTY